MSKQLEQLKRDLTKIQRQITYLKRKTPQGTPIYIALQKLWNQIDDFKAETSE